MHITNLTKPEIAKRLTYSLQFMGFLNKERTPTGTFNRILYCLQKYYMLNINFEYVHVIKNGKIYTKRRTNLMNKTDIAMDIANALLVEDCLNEVDRENILEDVKNIIAEKLKDYVIIRGELIK